MYSGKAGKLPSPIAVIRKYYRFDGGGELQTRCLLDALSSLTSVELFALIGILAKVRSNDTKSIFRALRTGRTQTSLNGLFVRRERIVFGFTGKIGSRGLIVSGSVMGFTRSF